MEVVGTAAAVAVVPAVHTTLAGAIMSAGVNLALLFSFSLFTWWTFWEVEDDMDDVNDSNGPREAALRCPPPEFLGTTYKTSINFGIAGEAGAGKSSLVNALRQLLPGESGAAPVGVHEVNADEPQSYPIQWTSEVAVEAKVWDLPGINRLNPISYVHDMGLRYFDAVFIVFSGRFTRIEKKLSEELDMFNVPHFFVRSQVDCDVQNEIEDYDKSEKEVIDSLRDDLAGERNTPSSFLISSRYPDKYDFKELVNNITMKMKARDRSHQDKDCPICFEAFDDDLRRSPCHWCNNAVCRVCAEHLQGKMEETPCPFCRRWTSLKEQEREGWL